MKNGVNAERFRTLMGRFPTGVTVLTTRARDGRVLGMTASAVAAASLDPPLVLVCVDRRCDVHAALEDRRSFALSMLAADQEDLSRRFAAAESDRFAGVSLRDAGDGPPVLAGASAHVACEWHASFPAGDHTAFLGLVTAGETSDRSPLIHYRGGYTSLPDGR